MTLNNLLKKFLLELNNIYTESEIKLIFYYIAEKILNTTSYSLKININKKKLKFKKKKFDNYLIDLKQYKPYQYILSESYFFDKKFFVNSNVFIPRPETEELIDWVFEEKSIPKIILDIGTGSGCIPIVLQNKFPKSIVFTCEKSKKAIQVAKKNCKIHNVKLNFIEQDFLDESLWNKLPIFDLIISNPPYIPEKEKYKLNKSIINFEPHLAFFVPNSAPFIFYHKILKFATLHLKPKGMIFFEIHQNYGQFIIDIISNFFNNFEIKKDLSGNNRMIKIINS